MDPNQLNQIWQNQQSHQRHVESHQRHARNHVADTHRPNMGHQHRRSYDAPRHYSGGGGGVFVNLVKLALFFGFLYLAFSFVHAQ